MILLFGIVNVTKEVLRKNRVSRNKNKVITIILCFVLSIGITAGITAIGIKLISNGQSKNIYADKLPLAVRDLVDVNSDDYIYELTQSKSIFLEKFETWQYPKYGYKVLPYIRYEIVFIKFDSLYDVCRNSIINKKYKDYKKIDEKQWSANEAYQLIFDDGTSENEYILFYDDKIIEISFEWNPTEQQKQIVYQKIGL